ncbi:MAG: polysaccharide biosynthesis C-terminal domain-containing protein [Bacteroidota bacterium]
MSSIKKQGIQNAIITYAGVGIGFISLLFIQPNLLKPEELGLTRILIAAASLIATILPLGVSTVTTKFFPYFRNEEKKHYGYFGFMLLFPLFGAILCGALVLTFKNVIISQYAQQSFLFTRFFDLLLPFSIIIGLNITLNAYCASLFKTTIISFFEGIFSRLLFIILIVVYYLKLIDLIQFMHLFVLSYLLQTISMTVYIYSVDKPSLKIDLSYLKSIGVLKMVKFGLLLTLATFSSISLKHLDTIMIGKYMSLDYVGIFSVAAYIALVIEIPLSSLERITHAKVAQAWANKDVPSIQRIYYQSVKYLMLGGGLLMVGIIANIHDLLGLLPEAYHQGATVATIACIGGFLNIATGVNTSILFTSDKYLYGTYLLFLLLILAVVLNIILIPVYGIVGAALATALSSVIYNALKYFIILKKFKMQPYDTSSLKILFVITLAFLTSYFLPSLNNAIVSMIMKSTVIIAVYAGLTYLLKIVPEFHKYIKLK